MKGINKMKYSNPRMSAIIENWPSGKNRVTAIFEIEQNKKGERATRKTTGAIKKLTYAVKTRIVDGDDGRTYIAELSMYGNIVIMNGDMKYMKESFNSKDEKYQELLTMFS
jgi:hypothetical protein